MKASVSKARESLEIVSNLLEFLDRDALLNNATGSWIKSSRSLQATGTTSALAEMMQAALVA